MPDLRVELGKRSYTISIRPDILDEAGSIIRNITLSSRALLVSNPTVFPLYGKRVMDSLHKAGFDIGIALMPDGEEYKNMDEAVKVLDKAVDFNLERTDIVIALGGGVVGDLAGFVAAVYHRGVDFIQIPTTLLSQVDSSVGGKVAVNHPRGKNLIGAFHQPKAVIIDPLTLNTLEEKEYKSGLGEVVKYGLIYDADFFAFLERNVENIKSRNPETVSELIYRSCRIKSIIVSQDETEQGIRALLNLGHTFGHALEKLTGYRAYSHGEAVAMGTVAASLLARERGYIDEHLWQRILHLYLKLAIYKPFPALNPEEVYEAMLNDKKVMYGKMRLILPCGIGQAVIADDVKKEEIIRAVREAQNLAID